MSRIILFLIFLFEVVFVYSQINTFQSRIFTLCADSFQGRRAGSVIEQKVYMYLVNQMSERKIKPFGKSDIYKVQFIDENAENKSGKNVITWIDKKAKESILICAHYDHLGMGGKYSRSIGKNKIHPGADDNASGVALLLELADFFSKENYKKYNLIFFFPTAHEEGLFGSKTFAQSDVFLSKKIKYVFNFDMVGRLDSVSKSLFVYPCCQMSKEDSAMFQLKTNINFVWGNNGNYQSDLDSFKGKIKQGFSFTTGIHDDYHKTSDTPDKINYKGLHQIAESIRAMILTLP